MFFFSLPAATFADSTAPDAKALITDKVIETARGWLANPIVGLSVNSQNKRRGALKAEDIEALDQKWRTEREMDDKPLISATLSAPLSIYLLRIQSEGIGLYRELFVMDANGLNVGQSAITGDYWQGDEAKFQKTFPEGKGAIFIDEAEWDEEFGIWKAQLNLTLSDETSGEPIGSATIEFNLTELQRRQGLSS
ncbi:hypothetical protein J0X15_10460 [Roseibium sp. CAU 1637]|uniref:Uncharacterized protein n=1 Tax=Roseibium limicola TaxID=2816037 RepID=A0A939EN58_9HYPH|nr:hypothetical protein [Roseibium limicola]